MIKAAIYARVSTGRQDIDLQLAALRQHAHLAGYKVTKEYVDHASGKSTQRPAFKEMMQDARKRRFKVLLVWKLDRLGRSLKDLVNTVDELGQLGIEFVSHQDNWDTSSPNGKLLFQIMGAVAEFERELIRERVIAGVQNARNKGRRLGRPTSDLDQEEIAAKKAESGLSNRALAAEYGVDEKTIRNLLNGGEKRPLVPNKETIEALKVARRGELIDSDSEDYYLAEERMRTYDQAKAIPLDELVKKYGRSTAVRKNPC